MARPPLASASLRQSIAARLSPESFDLSIDEQDPDRQTLRFRYPGCWPDLVEGYFGRFVKIEMGARSDPWPTERLAVTPYVAELFPAKFKTGERFVAGEKYFN